MENSVKTVYLHIGMPKAGSTSLQLFCYHNADKLKEKSVLYPIADNLDKKTNGRFINYRQIIFDVYNAELEEKSLENYNRYFEERFLPIINNSDCNKIVFSEEGIWKNDVSPEICDIMFRHGFNVKVIAYIRRPVEYLASYWQEHLKPFHFDLSFNCTLNECLENVSVNYEILEKYIDKLGKDNVIIRPFESSQWKNNDLYEDFLSVIGIEKLENPEIKRVNESPFNRDAAEFMQMLRTNIMSQKQFTRYIYEYAVSLAPKNETEKLDPKNREKSLKLIEKYQPKSPKIINSISDDIILKITDKYEPVLKRLARLYGKEDFFINKFPECYHSTDRMNGKSIYDRTPLSLKQIMILFEAIINRKSFYKYKGRMYEYNLMANDTEDEYPENNFRPNVSLSDECLKIFYDSICYAYENSEKLYNEKLNIQKQKFENEVNILKNNLIEEKHKINELEKELNREQRKSSALENAINILEEKIKINNIPFYKKIFSVQNCSDKKIVRILGLKFSFKKND